MCRHTNTPGAGVGGANFFSSYLSRSSNTQKKEKPRKTWPLRGTDRPTDRSTVTFRGRPRQEATGEKQKALTGKAGKCAPFTGKNPGRKKRWIVTAHTPEKNSKPETQLPSNRLPTNRQLQRHPENGTEGWRWAAEGSFSPLIFNSCFARNRRCKKTRSKSPRRRRRGRRHPTRFLPSLRAVRIEIEDAKL